MRLAICAVAAVSLLTGCVQDYVRKEITRLQSDDPTIQDDEAEELQNFRPEVVSRFRDSRDLPSVSPPIDAVPPMGQLADRMGPSK